LGRRAARLERGEDGHVDALAVVDSRWRGPAHRVTTVLAAFSLFAASFATWQTVVQVPVTG